MAQAERQAQVSWSGDLIGGEGKLTFKSSGMLSETPVTWASRTEQPDGRTSPEELLAAAHASCFAMAFAAGLARGRTPPQQLDVTAVCSLDRTAEGGFKVTAMRLTVRGRVPGLDKDGFQKAAEAAKEGCPISNALKGNVQISLDATLDG
jgi:osmotically inducible protein OsmC